MKGSIWWVKKFGSEPEGNRDHPGSTAETCGVESSPWNTEVRAGEDTSSSNSQVPGTSLALGTLQIHLWGKYYYYSNFTNGKKTTTGIHQVLAAWKPGSSSWASCGAWTLLPTRSRDSCPRGHQASAKTPLSRWNQDYVMTVQSAGWRTAKSWWPDYWEKFASEIINC